MKIFLSATGLLVLMLPACKEAHTGRMGTIQASQKDTAAPPPVITVLSQLPDSLQPKTILLKDQPKPTVIAIATERSGSAPLAGTKTKTTSNTPAPPVVKTLPVVQTKEGAPITDKEGNAIILGTHGIAPLTPYGSDLGLALDAVFCTFIDSKGNLWVGTGGGGASRFDGQRFTNFNLPHGMAGTHISHIMEDRRGHIWFSGEGINRYDGKQVTSLTLTNPALAWDNYTDQLFEDKEGYMWALKYGSMLRFDPSTLGAGGNRLFETNSEYTFEEHLDGNRVTCINQDQKGVMWFGTEQGGVYRFDGKRFTAYTTADGLGGNSINSILLDKKGLLWFGTNAGLTRYDHLKFTNYAAKDGLPGTSVGNITEDRRGHIWFANANGLTSFDGVRFTTHAINKEVASLRILSVTADKKGQIYIGTFGGGVFRFDDTGITNYTAEQGLGDDEVRSILEDKKGAFWFGTNGRGVSHFDGTTFTTYTTAQGLAGNGIWSISEDSKGNIWIGSRGRGVSRFDGKHFVTYTRKQGLAGDDITKIIEDRKGNIWISTVDGLSRFDGAGFTNFTKRQGLTDNFVGLVFEDSRGILWISYYAKGLTLFDGKRFVTLTTAHGLSNNHIIDIAEDNNGNLWIGTPAGLDLLPAGAINKLLDNGYALAGKIATGESTAQNKAIFKTFTTADGLPDNNIIQVQALKEGKIAVGTNKGIGIFDAPKQVNETVDTLRDVEIFNNTTGFPVKDFTYGQNALFQDSKGILWAGTVSRKSALVRFDYKALNKNRHLPELTIQGVRIKEEPISWHSMARADGADTLSRHTTPAPVVEELIDFDRVLGESERQKMRTYFEGIRFDSIRPFYPVPVNLELPHWLNQITIQYATNELAKPYLIEYRYILEGYNKDWTPAHKRTSATFGNLYEGTYTFKVKARYTGISEGDAGAWTEPISYSFVVLPPWYRSWWAYTFYILLIASAIYAFINWRTRKLKREKLTLEAKVVERTDELKKSLDNLKATQQQLVQSEKMASLGELTAGIAHEIQNPLNFVNNFSDVNTELIAELEQEAGKGNIKEVLLIANDIRENEQKINHHGKRADAIVKGMLQHSRSSSGAKQPTDINVLADEYMRLAYHGIRAKDKTFNATLHTDFDKSIGSISIIPQDMGRVILNLISNAFYAVNEKLSMANDAGDKGYEPQVAITTQKTGNHVLLTIKDNGNGIPNKVVDKIFQPFFTTKPTGQGTGLGLSLSYDIVKAHGGELKVETTQGEGSLFIIQLPLN